MAFRPARLLGTSAALTLAAMLAACAGNPPPNATVAAAPGQPGLVAGSPPLVPVTVGPADEMLPLGYPPPPPGTQMAAIPPNAGPVPPGQLAANAVPVGTEALLPAAPSALPGTVPGDTTMPPGDAYDPQLAALASTTTYAAMTDHGHDMRAINTKGFNPKYLRQIVDYPTVEAPGTIVVDPQNRFLYLVQEHGKAIRYGVGVGKAGLEWNGEAHVGWKQPWPRWTPTKDMQKRDPKHYGQYADGMAGGPGNPLGARAMYLFNDKGQDTLYRIHGTTEPSSIGTAASSGCIRMFNQDVIDLYSRVPTATKVVVL